MNKLFYGIAWFTIISAIIIIAVVIYWLLYPYKTTDYNNLPFPIKNKIVKGGEYVEFTINVCKYSDIQPTISRSFVDGIIYQVPDSIGQIYDLGCSKRNIFMYVPKALPPGVYSVHSTYRWKVNPIRIIEKKTTTEQFTVIK